MSGSKADSGTEEGVLEELLLCEAPPCEVPPWEVPPCEVPEGCEAPLGSLEGVGVETSEAPEDGAPQAASNKGIAKKRGKECLLFMALIIA